MKALADPIFEFDFLNTIILINYNPSCMSARYSTPPLHSRWLLLLKIEISLVVNFRSITNQNELKFVIAHLVFNLTSNVDRKWGCYT
jgi:hypothetical protein